MNIVGNTRAGVARCQERNRTMLRLLAGGHDPNDLIRLGPYDCTPCQLPTGHKAAHWTACRPSPKETS